MAEHLASMCKVLGSVPDTERKIKLEGMNITVVEFEFRMLGPGLFSLF